VGEVRVEKFISLLKKYSILRLEVDKVIKNYLR
jgi:hypothetical protein